MVEATRRRGYVRPDEDHVAPGELLSEQEQIQLITTLETQDDKTNDIYKIVLTAICFMLAMYYGYTMSFSITSASVISALSLTTCPIFILGTSYERVQRKEYQYSFLALVLFSSIPFWIGRDVFWAIPLLVVLLNAMVIRDMYIVKRDLKSLQSKTYKFKGV